MSASIPIDPAALESDWILAAVRDELSTCGATIRLSPIQGVVPIGICSVETADGSYPEQVSTVLMGNFAAMLGEEREGNKYVFTFRIA